MAITSNKHSSAERILLSSFDGGLATDRPPEQLQMNELSVADNVYYDVTTNYLKVVPAAAPFHKVEGPIKELFWSTIGSCFIYVVEGGDVYAGGLTINDRYTGVYRNSDSVFGNKDSVYKYPAPLVTGDTKIGTLSGGSSPVMREFGEKICIASGGDLQVWDGVPSSPLESVEILLPDGNKAGEGRLYPDSIETWGNRLLAAQSSKDIIIGSELGSAVDWKYSEGTSTDISYAQWVYVGLKDSARISSISALSSDIIISKRKADGSPINYRLVGSFDTGEINVVEINRTSHVYGQKCMIQAQNDLFYLGQNGFETYSTVQQYGDMQMKSAGRRVNKLINQLSGPTARLWHVMPYGQIWIQPSSASNDIYMFHYQNGAFSRRRVWASIGGVAVRDRDVFVGIGDQILQLNESRLVDSWGRAIKGIAKTKKFRGKEAWIIKQIRVNVAEENNLRAEVRIGPTSVPLQSIRRGDLIYRNGEMIWKNDKLIYQGDSNLSQRLKRTNLRLPTWEAELAISNGRMTLDSIEIEVVEVN